ncbi:MAG TPA: AsmA-like C-terminal region-containing protein [Terriglobales bacterium]|nr:AsmA-like C-terminal region-containing protein [Terriglobales bacterium]
MQQVMIPSSSQKTRKYVIFAALVVVVISISAMVVLVWHWPFSREAVVKELEDASQSRVEVGAFHGTYFPRPGCILEHVTFRHNPKAGTPPLITVERLRIEGTFSGLFMKHIKRIGAEGLRILIPPRGSEEHFQTPQRSPFVIDDLIADGAILEVASREADKPPLEFSFHNFVLSDVGRNGPASFRARLSNPEPPGEITTTGKFGPWNQDDVGKTGVSGEYLFQQADLGVFRGIAGVLSSSGKFSGVLDRIEVEGLTDTPRFTVTSSSHQVQLRTQFHAVVNGGNGDTFLQKVAATCWKTTVLAEGSVSGTPGQSGKTASIELGAKGGRIQDILLLFSRSERAPMSGIVGFHAKVSIPPGKRPFLEKVELQGDFGIDAGSFTKSDTQEGVNHLSEGALGEEDHHKPGKEEDDDPATVLSDLKGHVALRDGTARFSNLSFGVPGALAQLQGTYNLLTEKIDMRGTLTTDSRPSSATQGIKALMLKVLDPFFKKKHVGYVVPVKIAGTYDHPSFGLDLSDRDDKKPHKKNVRVPRFLREANTGQTSH